MPGGCELACIVGRGDADGFGAEVQCHQPQAHRQGGNDGQGGIEKDGHGAGLSVFSRMGQQFEL